MRKRALKNTTPAENCRLRKGEVQINCDVPRAIAAGLDRYCKRENEKRKTVLTRALLRLLVKEGVMRA